MLSIKPLTKNTIIITTAVTLIFTSLCMNNCATMPVDKKSEQVPEVQPRYEWLPEDIRKTISKVGVLSVEPLPKPIPKSKKKKEPESVSVVGRIALGGLSGATAGFLGGLILGVIFYPIVNPGPAIGEVFGIENGSRDSDIISCGIIGGGIGLVMGTMIGGLTAGEEKVKQKAESASSQQFGPFLTEAVSSHIVEIGELRTGYSFFNVEIDKSTSPEAIVDYSVLQNGETDAILEIRVSSGGCSRSENDKNEFRCFIKAYARLVDNKSGKPLLDRSFQYYGERVEFIRSGSEEYFVRGDEINAYLHLLTEDIIDSIFLMDSFSAKFPTPSYSSLGPEDKDFKKKANRTNMSIYPSKLYVEVDSLKPLLKWKPFPSEQDYQVNENVEKLNKIEYVSYDARIWKAEGGDRPVVFIHEVEGLKENSYRVPDSLEPGTKYFWTVRARFTENGLVSVTRWTDFWPFITPSIAETQ
jgi:hypothetical protein